MSPTTNQSFLLDENVSKRLAKALQAARYSIVRALDAHLGAKPDADVFRYARAHHHAIITWDKDYLDRAKFSPPHAGILIMRLPRNTSIPDLVRTVLCALTDLAGQDLSNNIYEITMSGVQMI